MEASALLRAKESSLSRRPGSTLSIASRRLTVRLHWGQEKGPKPEDRKIDRPTLSHLNLT